MNEITASLEDYLEAIYILAQRQPEPVRVTDLSVFLAVTKPSANRAVGTLREGGYLEHESYGGITLTSKGEEKAAQVLGRHKMLKRFLCDTLGVTPEVAETDACRVEHVVSEETMEKLGIFLDGIKG